MSDLLVPIPKIDVSVRVATLADVPFMDALQKRHGKALGHFPTKQFEGYIQMGAVLVAESGGQRVGYIIHKDRYLKRDELGVIFQLCVTQGEQRKLVGATLVGEAFRRSAYGCRLYCLWCAQDLDANYFWESLGFVPIAFRAGSDRKKRVHIFWQKRIVEGDVETKWWYPFQTAGGALRADRVVFPIPEGTHWRDVTAVELTEAKQIQDSPRRHGDTEAAKTAKRASVPQCLRGEKKPPLRPMGGFRFQSEIEAERPVRAPRESKAKAIPAKIDPKYLKAARELRDRWMEHVNAGGMLLETVGKYDVVRQRHLSATATHPVVKQLPLAA
jgi:hypothetical protein